MRSSAKESTNPTMMNDFVPLPSAIFKPLDAEDPENLPTEIESLCVNCEEMGITKILLTRIPFYKDVILMSFYCDKCGYRNNEIQSGTKVQEQGVKYIVKIRTKSDLNRQIVKSRYAGVIIPEIDFEIPSGSQVGEITNVEGIITRSVEALKQDQEHRRMNNSKEAEQIDEFIAKLQELCLLDKEFTIILDDPSGDSFVENPNPYQVDPNAKVVHYHRTLQQDKLLALVADDVEENGEEDSAPPVWESKEEIKNEVLHFNVSCPDCKAPAETNMKIVNIPYFKEVVIMATNCSECGSRTSEVKSSCGIADQGVRFTLIVRHVTDLTRDVLKSETCGMRIPELDLELGMGILAGRFTTVEGLLNSVKDELIEHGGFLLGDSAQSVAREKMSDFVDRLTSCIQLKHPFTLILDDPAGNSYIQSLTAPLTDESLKVEYYERNYEQNEDLGLNDMKTENYEEQQDNVSS